MCAQYAAHPSVTKQKMICRQQTAGKGHGWWGDDVSGCGVAGSAGSCCAAVQHNCIATIWQCVQDITAAP